MNIESDSGDALFDVHSSGTQSFFFEFFSGVILNQVGSKKRVRSEKMESSEFDCSCRSRLAHVGEYLIVAIGFAAQREWDCLKFESANRVRRAESSSSGDDLYYQAS